MPAEEITSRKRITKDGLIYMFLDMQKESTKYMANINLALNKINDNNLLHTKALESSKEAIKANTSATSDMSKAFVSVSRSFNSFFSFFKVLILLLVGTLIILVGGEKVFKFFPLFR